MLPISIYAFKSAIENWLDFVNSKDSLLSLAYKTSLDLKNTYATKIKDLLHKLNFDHVWVNQTTFSKRKLLFSVVSRLKDLYMKYSNKTANLLMVIN